MVTIEETTSTGPEDVFFLVQKCYQRALAVRDVNKCQALLETIAKVLRSELLVALQKRAKLEFRAPDSIFVMSLS